MNTKYKYWTIFLIGMFFLVGCCGESIAQQKTATGVAESSSLEQRCKELGVQNKQEYQVVSGKVLIASSLSLMGTRDCLSKNCPEIYDGVFRAVMLPLMIKEDDKVDRLWVYTKKEDIRDLSKKQPYMSKNKSYEFCARGPIITGAHKDRVTYYIDDVETIHQLK